MPEPAWTQLDNNRILQVEGTEQGRYGSRLYTYKAVGAGRLDHANLNEVLPFNPTAENIARWITEQIPQCYKCMVQESEGNRAIYEED